MGTAHRSCEIDPENGGRALPGRSGGLTESPEGVLPALKSVSKSATYPEDALLLVEGQPPDGVYLLRKGKVKLSVSSADGNTLIMRIAEPGEMLGRSAVLLGQPHEFTAETLEPVHVNFIRRDDVLRLLNQHGDACLRVAEQLSRQCRSAWREMSSIGLARSTVQRLANLLLQWECAGQSGEANTAAAGRHSIRLTLTREEIAQLIGTTRETVSRILSSFRRRNLIEQRGSRLTILNYEALDAIRHDRPMHQESRPCAPVGPRASRSSANNSAQDRTQDASRWRK